MKRYELNKLGEFGKAAIENGKALVLASIWKTEGSSYRKIWTQMLVADDLTYAGHLSGGCVEKQVCRQAEFVFKDKTARTFEYDGSFKLGCKGIIHILLEYIEEASCLKWINIIEQSNKNRSELKQGFILNNEETAIGSFYEYEGTVNFTMAEKDGVKSIHRNLPPTIQLIIIGSEFDSLQLAHVASDTGYHVKLIVSTLSKKANDDYEFEVISAEPETISNKVKTDEWTAVLLMTHSFSKDILYLLQLVDKDVKYIGSLGPKQRKQDIIDYIFENYADQHPEILQHIDKIEGPLGIDIPSKTPEQISVSILAMLQSIFNS